MAARNLLVSLLLLMFQTTSYAALKLPDVLQDWSAWVLRDQPEHGCPIATGEEHVSCVWFSGMEVTSSAESANFELRVSSFAKNDQRIQLPGDETNWPKEVMLDGRSAVVLEQGSQPTLLISEGEHRVTGKFSWNGEPATLTVPQQIAIINLTHNGKAIANPIIQQGQLTLAEGAQQNLTPLQDSLTVRVFRKIEEAVPLQLVSRIELDVSGRAREINLGKLFDTTVQLESISADVPVRVDNENNLIAQVKSGSWTVMVKAHYSGPIDAAGPVKQSEENTRWPEDEIWVYQPNTAIRSVSFTNLDSLDTQQTEMPQEWKSFTAWKLNQGDTLSWTTQSRGTENIQSNKLNLVREAWLDFSAQKWTIRDSIKGQLYSDWRIMLSAPYELGSVLHDESPLVVVKYDDGNGVELRNKNVSLQAMSRIDSSDFNTNLGWKNDFESARLYLNLPPGWSVFTVSGVSEASPTWIAKWNLWDIFWILLITVATARLIGFGWAGVGLVVLVLNYHEPNAPVWVWMSLLITAALIKVVTHPNWNKVFVALQAVCALILAVITIPYAIQQVRQAIYPQLENNSSYYSADAMLGSTVQFETSEAPVAAAPAPELLMEENMADQDMQKAERAQVSRKRLSAASAIALKPALEKPDQSAQTGPAQMQWQWHRIALTWSGPVRADESFQVWLISPLLERVFAFLRVAGIFIFAYGILKGVARIPAKAAASVMLVCLAVLVQPQNAKADIPTQTLLDQLKTELTKAPECNPDCLGNSETVINVQRATLEISQKLQAASSLAVKLPSFTDAQLTSVRLDGKPAVLNRLNDDELVLWLPEGVHTLELQARLLGSTVEVTFNQSPRNVKVNASEWSYEGLEINRLPSNSIKFEFLEKNKDEPLARFPATVVAPFVRVERVIKMGQEWSVFTRVVRVAPENGAITLKLPLLSGEHVLTEGTSIENNQVAVSLRPDMSEVSWDSKLDLSQQLDITAGSEPSYYESWKFIPSNYWRLQFQGFPAKADDASDVWQPEFLPFPGEKLSASIHALQPAEGVSLTFDSVNLEFTPGERLTRSVLNASFRSTKGGEHEFVIPPNSVIENIFLDNQAVPRIDPHANPKISFTPGKHQISITWKNDLYMHFWTQSLPISFKQVVSNINLVWRVPADRWILLVSGATMGPAVLFWGTFILIIAISLLLGRSKLTPVSTLSWVVLGAGMSTTSLWVGVTLVIWFVLLQWRGKKGNTLAETPFNFLQLSIGFLTLIMVLGLVFSVPQSLLGSPDMGVVGNGSTANELRWYHDHTNGDLPQVWIISLPMWVYRVAMLIWALWLAFKFIDWLRWGWDQFSEGGAWKKMPVIAKKVEPKTKQPGS